MKTIRRIDPKDISKPSTFRVDGRPVVGERVMFPHGEVVTVAEVLWQGRAKDGVEAAQVVPAWDKRPAVVPAPRHECPGCGKPTTMALCPDCA